MQELRDMDAGPMKDDTDAQTDSFWRFRGLIFVRRAGREIYEPVDRRHRNDEIRPRPITIHVKRDWFDVAGWAIGLGTLIIVGLYTHYAGGQWIEMRKAAKATADAAQTAASALDENKRQFQNTLEQMRNQTKAQEEAADLSKESLIQLQRAFVTFPGSMSVAKKVVNNKIAALTVTVPWLNIGGTSTVDAKGKINWKIFPASGMPQNFDFSDQPGGPPQVQFSIASHLGANATMDIQPILLKVVSDNQMRLYMWGWMTYRDVFKGTSIHLSEFCDEVKDVKISKNDPQDPSAEFTWQLSFCTVPHNCYDRECADYESEIKK